MVFYFHGDNLVASRQQLNSLKSKFLAQNPNGRIIILTNKEFDPVALKSKLVNLSLLDNKYLYFIENLKKFNPAQKKKLYAILSKAKKEIIFWDNQATNLFKEVKQHFPSAQLLAFPQPKLTFKFLELVYPGNQKAFLPMWEKLLKQQPLELVFYFLKKQCHNLITASSQSSSLTGWQKNKLLAQRKKFPLNQLVSFYLNLIELEYHYKTGQLVTQLQIPLANLLCTL